MGQQKQEAEDTQSEHFNIIIYSSISDICLWSRGHVGTSQQHSKNSVQNVKREETLGLKLQQVQVILWLLGGRGTLISHWQEKDMLWG